ncbi:MAG: hypothetical protein M1826_004826 [Phylliscum demangeonii]|nr:MAG: hypothetical protein M1826_004826 [Phylliscum demangeonii]
MTLMRDRGVDRMYDPGTVREFVRSRVDGDRIREYLKHLTAFDHVAGTQGDYASAEYVKAQFAAAKLDEVEVKEYQVYLNYPRPSGRRVAIIHPANLTWEAKLEEDRVYADEDSLKVQTAAFHGHSRAGNVTGPLIYANYGSREDFKTLERLGISVRGAIVLVRYYGTQGDRALKVKAAELAGAAGCLIYSDPADDGFRKGEVWPKGRWRPSDGVQRGAVSLMSWVVGDVLTPGYASTPDAVRVSKDQNPGLVNIPSLPLAWRDAQPLLQCLKGHGAKVDDDWIGGVPGVDEWRTGNQSSPTILLANEQDEEDKQPIWNVLGKIRGVEEPAKTVIVGNHRDAWCFGGGDPGSGTAVMLEVVRIFSGLCEQGWRPLRTIQFASWDGEEYNLIGSTEWVEEHVDDLRRNGVGYINLDTAVTGPTFQASASPMFRGALMQVLLDIPDPDRNETLHKLWHASNSTLTSLGAGSDYVAFQDIAGTSSIDLSFQGPSHGFPYHSCYDHFEWMETFGDPGFRYHKVLAQVIALLILQLADSVFLPLDVVHYASAIDGYIRDLETRVRDTTTHRGGKDMAPPDLDLEPLRRASQQLMRDARTFHRYESSWSDSAYDNGGMETNVMAVQRISHNAKLARFETDLLDLRPGGGLPGRRQFKHVLFAPQTWSGYDAAVFPGVLDAIDAGNWTGAQQQIGAVAAQLTAASWRLLH